MIELDRLYPGPGQILAKAEFLQPGGSIKDRTALEILTLAERQGLLHPRQRVVEMTSGNMGAGLAVVCNLLLHPLTLAMSAGNSSERVAMLTGLGAEVILVDQADGRPGEVTGLDIAAATTEAERLASDLGAYYVDQFHNEGNILAHLRTTRPEVWEQSNGEVDGFVSCVGTGGTFTGISQFLKSRRTSIVCAAVEPAGAEVLAGNSVSKPRHILQGTGYGQLPPNWNPDLMDLSIAVTDDEAIEYRHRLAVDEGLYVGYSSAANVCAAAKLLNSGQVGPRGRVVTVLCDTGLKYPAKAVRSEDKLIS